MRIDALLLSVEPVVANPANSPCRAQSKSLLNLSVLGINLGVLSAQTTTSAVTLLSTAEANTAKLGILNLLGILLHVSADALDAKAQVQLSSHGCVLSSSSTVTNAVIQGKPISLLTTPLDIAVPLVGVIHLNATLGGDHPSFGPPNHNVVAQRALWLEVTDPLLALVLRDVIVSEAIADVSLATCI